MSVFPMAEKQEIVQPEQLHFEDDGVYPGSVLPVLLYRGRSQSRRRTALLFSIAHSLRMIGETPGETASIPLLIIIARRTKCSVSMKARAKLRLGGEHGQTVEVRSGDVFSFLQGVAHHNIAASPDFSVVGAYPDGREWDLLRGLPGERPKSDHTIAALPIPDYDPIYGADGPLAADLESR
jgi:hypothetical protein